MMRCSGLGCDESCDGDIQATRRNEVGRDEVGGMEREWHSHQTRNMAGSTDRVPANHCLPSTFQINHHFITPSFHPPTNSIPRNMASKPFVRLVPERPSWRISLSDITGRSANPIGRGGFGEVFTGTYFGSKVAIKQLLGNYNNRELADYNYEISIWKQLSHPNILPLLGTCDQDDDGNPISPFMVSPFMPNGTLLNHVSDANDHVPLDEKLRLLYQVASGMAYLHGRRIIHGDLKAANVLLDGLNNAVVTDFGMSRTKHTSASM
ncbi:kinase-like domain-containing protein, partial [Polychytrium aggregatum]|uniref:kinase-like domain-containing protein n=1 Tax=Polychytrium aggregatum TaxID=110093 RepID=UPI0022FE884C